MKIGIPFKASVTVFGSGKGQAIIACAEVCKALGHEVVLIQEMGPWWSDIEGLVYDRVPVGCEKVCDVLLDIDGQMDPDVRSAMAAKVIVFFRSDPSLEYLERAAYMSQETSYSLQGAAEVWVWDVMVPSEKVPLIQTMMEDLPVKRVPYVWTPLLLKQYLANEVKSETAKPLVTPEKGWTALISEKNTHITSSCLIPLLGSAKASNIDEILVCNGQDLKTNLFFQENLVKNAVQSKIHYEGRIRYADLLEETSCLMISHIRHAPFRPGLLDILWLGLPLIHNCPLLKPMGVYYPEQDVEALTKAITQFSTDTYNLQREWIRNCVEEEWSVRKGLAGWKQAFEEGTIASQTLRIVFTDMWEGFDPTDNFFLDLMRSVQPVTGAGSGPCDLVICGPFGTQWQQYKNVKKVYYSGEPPMPGELDDSRIDLFLTHSPIKTDRCMRLPVWALFIDWFGKGFKPTRNPNGLAKELALQPATGKRNEFCAFVVSNPLSQERNAAFEAVNAYCPVNSGGSYRNTIGGPLKSLYGGGGGGDQAKFEFLKKHEFCICYENCVLPGYVTEKLLHAKMAGCVPLYRGAEEAAMDFNPNGFIHVKDGQDIVELIKDLEVDPERQAAMAQTPALDPIRYTQIQESMATIGRRLVELASSKAVVKPRNEIVQPVLQEAVSTGRSPVFVSFATQLYMPSVLGAIQSVEALRKKDSGIRMRVYLGSDVVEDRTVMDKYAWVEYKRLPPAPDSFPDMFEPKMFGWKLWLLHDVCHDPELQGDPVIYADAGSSWISVPQDMLSVVQESGVCLIKDRSQKNVNWCSESMVQEMGVTASELGECQLSAATLGFQAGHPKAIRLLDEALKWGSKKSCLFGSYVGGIGADGRPFGHRHDQSILSILSIRQQCPLLDMVRSVCDISLRKTYQKGTPLYLHRGNPIIHKQPILGIDDVWVVSLDRRPDRWQSLLLAHPSLAPIANRLPGIDGRELQLTPHMASLFAKNDFKWKKSVMGCALSHILIWAQLVSEHPSVQNYLILEDDCRFVKPLSDLEAIVKAAPPDAELLMLGGVLPANVTAYPQVLEPVNELWATIRPNNLFTGAQPMPFFHFCTYSYILTRAGAKKLLATLQTHGVHTSIDHYLIHPNQGLKMYVLKDLVTTCFQAEDPVYKTASFNEFLRIDSYDSDIWNNKECFQNIILSNDTSLQLWPVLVDVLSQAPHSIQTRNTLREEAISLHTPSTVYYCPDESKKADATLEEGWLKSLWPTIHYRPFPSIDSLPSNAWLLVARPALEFWQQVCKELSAANKPFNILHLSDEGCTDPIEFYNYPACKKVIRNYARANLDEKVLVLPLGWAVPPPSSTPPPVRDRPNVWGFHGSSWADRETLLKPLMSVTPHTCRFITGFQSKDKTNTYEYQQMLLKSQCVPVPRGNHAETFRLYEALEHGAIPFYVRLEGGLDRDHWNWLRGHLHLLEISSWDKLPAILELFRKNPEKAEVYRAGLLVEWAAWKTECKTYFP
jgi:GR25 family glycosyltransferase involved in LPS biosynthesis